MIVSPRMPVSLHTHKGVQLYQFNPEQQIGLSWGRELRQVSQCQITVPTPAAYGQMLDIQPWVHWITVWQENGKDVLWRGPVQHIAANRETIALSCRDVSIHYQKTRTPLTKKWDAADPSTIANELWIQMLEDKGINVAPIVRPDPLGDRFDYAATRDAVMMEENIQELTQKGLRWCVVAGVPILGPMPLRSIGALGEQHFTGKGLTLVRDGANTYNDVVLRAADVIARGREHIEGQNLQSIVNVDDMFGVSNANKAVRQYLREVGKIRDALVVPPDAELHPDAPISIDQLIPSTRFTVTGLGQTALMELKSMNVTCTPEKTSITVNLEGVNDEPPELTTISQQGVIT